MPRNGRSASDSELYVAIVFTVNWKFCHNENSASEHKDQCEHNLCTLSQNRRYNSFLGHIRSEEGSDFEKTSLL